MPNMISPENFIWFVFLSIAFLVLCGVVLQLSRTVASKLIALGILAAVASVGYGGLIMTPTILPLASGVMKIAVILALGGVACAILSSLGSPPVPDVSIPKEPLR